MQLNTGLKSVPATQKHHQSPRSGERTPRRPGLKAWRSLSLPAVAGVHCSGVSPKQTFCQLIAIWTAILVVHHKPLMMHDSRNQL